MGGVSDDSFRGQDSYHGLDIIVPVGDNDYIVGEVKKELKLTDEWYKIKSKAEKLLKEHPEFGNRYAVVATRISTDIHHEMLKYDGIKFVPIALNNPDKEFLLKDKDLESRIALEKVAIIEGQIDKVLIERTSTAKKQKKKQRS